MKEGSRQPEQPRGKVSRSYGHARAKFRGTALQTLVLRAPASGSGFFAVPETKIRAAARVNNRGGATRFGGPAAARHSASQTRVKRAFCCQEKKEKKKAGLFPAGESGYQAAVQQPLRRRNFDRLADCSPSIAVRATPWLTAITRSPFSKFSYPKGGARAGRSPERSCARSEPPPRCGRVGVGRPAVAAPQARSWHCPNGRCRTIRPEVVPGQLSYGPRSRIACPAGLGAAIARPAGLRPAADTGAAWKLADRRPSALSDVPPSPCARRLRRGASNQLGQAVASGPTYQPAVVPRE